jgi:hypothetical protein
MPKIPQRIIDRVIDTARIEDVVGEFVDLKRDGPVNLTGLCPFHEDRHTGNFIVRPAGVIGGGANTFHCFACMSDKEGGGPVDFLMRYKNLSFPDAIRWLGKRYNIDVDDKDVDFTPTPKSPPPPPLPQLTFDRSVVKESMKGIERTIFVKWLYSLPWRDDMRERLPRVLWSYCVATCPHGLDWVAFWQISHEGKAITAKYMRYHADGHRVKDKDEQGNKVFAADWHHAWARRNNLFDATKWSTSGRALFGEHLLKRYPNAKVNIVESEKTALIMATYYGDMEHNLWLACGGLKFLKMDMMQPLVDQQRTIWLWPDKDGAEEWKAWRETFQYKECHIYTEFFKHCWREADGPKADIADIALRMLCDGEKPRPSEIYTTDGAEQVSEERRVKSEVPSSARLSTCGAQEFAQPQLAQRQGQGSNETLHPPIVEDPHLQRMIDILELEEITTHTNATQ